MSLNEPKRPAPSKLQRPTLLQRLFPSPMEHPDIIRVGWMRGNALHNTLVFLYHMARVPLPLCVLLVGGAAAAVALVFEFPLVAGALLVGNIAGDLLLLLLLPRLRISFGWVSAPFLEFSAGRVLLALLAGLLLPSPAQLHVLAAIQLTLTMLSWYGHLVEPFWIQHTHLRWKLPDLGAPLRVLFISDLHIERLTRREAAVLDAIERQQPEVVLIGGDVLNLSYVGDPRALEQASTFLSQLSAPGGVYFIRGTWDVDPPHLINPMVQQLENLIPVNGSRLTVEHGGARFQLVGIPADLTPEERTRLLRELCEGARPPTVCVHHLPDLVEEAAAAGVDIYLAGHTHGGQICIPLLGPIFTGSKFGRRYLRGFHQVQSTRAYISRGIGMEGLGAPRMRFLARPEMIWIDLEPE